MSQNVSPKKKKGIVYGLMCAGIALAALQVYYFNSEYKPIKRDNAPLTLPAERIYPVNESIVGSIPGDGPDPLLILDVNKDGIADIISTSYKQALYVAPGYRGKVSLLFDDYNGEDTKTLDGDLRRAATKVMQADQELTTLLHK